MSCTHEQAIRADAASGFAARTGAAVKTFLRYVWETNAAVRAGLVARRLNELSDKELAGLGIKREGIVAYAFRNHTGH
ncbi:MAG: hypothetical protein WD969_05800 [Paracoccaceae bacterium]